MKYRESTENEKPNEIYKQVFEDNGKYTFESDIYSMEFFGFVLEILNSITDIKDANANKVKFSGL